MKCIRELNTGKITRVKDADASTKVKTGRFAYCPKSDWKEQVRPKKVETAKVDKSAETK
jgi:hypothetical protein